MASMESRVVPATSLTMARLEPKRVLRREDLPTFGRPTIATLISSCNKGVSTCVERHHFIDK